MNVSALFLKLYPLSLPLKLYLWRLLFLSESMSSSMSNRMSDTELHLVTNTCTSSTHSDTTLVFYIYNQIWVIVRSAMVQSGFILISAFATVLALLKQLAITTGSKCFFFLICFTTPGENCCKVYQWFMMEVPRYQASLKTLKQV